MLWPSKLFLIFDIGVLNVEWPVNLMWNVVEILTFTLLFFCVLNLLNLICKLICELLICKYEKVNNKSLNKLLKYKRNFYLINYSLYWTDAAAPQSSSVRSKENTHPNN